MKRKVGIWIILCLVLVMAVAAALSWETLYEIWKGEPEVAVETPVIEEPEPDPEPVMLPRFAELFAQNEDLVGWIRVPGTGVDYPVVQGGDNAFYLEHDFNKNPSKEGIPFLDKDAGLLENNRSLSLFAHYLRGDKQFTNLHRYKNLDYYKQYPTFEFDSLYEEAQYKIFAVFYMAGNATDGNFYYYPVSSFADDQAFMEHVAQITKRSIFLTGVDVLPEDQLVLLTCCTYETKNLRLIVAGRKVRSKEDLAVNTEKAAVNPMPLYPQKWYDARGGSYTGS